MSLREILLIFIEQSDYHPFSPDDVNTFSLQSLYNVLYHNLPCPVLPDPAGPIRKKDFTIINLSFPHF
jgi:hypothetical protein